MLLRGHLEPHSSNTLKMFSLSKDNFIMKVNISLEIKLFC